MHLLHSSIVASLKPFIPLCRNSCHSTEELSCKRNSRSPALSVTCCPCHRDSNNSAVDHCCVSGAFSSTCDSSYLLLLFLRCLGGSLLNLEKKKQDTQDVRARQEAVRRAWAAALFTSCVSLGSLLHLSVSYCSHLQSTDNHSIFPLGCCEELMG